MPLRQILNQHVHSFLNNLTQKCNSSPVLQCLPCSLCAWRGNANRQALDQGTSAGGQGDVRESPDGSA